MRGVFIGSVHIECLDGGAAAIITFDATTDSGGLGAVLGMVARNHLQQLPPAALDREFREMLAAFVVNAADREPVEVLEGSTEMLAMQPPPERTQ